MIDSEFKAIIPYYILQYLFDVVSTRCPENVFLQISFPTICFVSLIARVQY